ncbi:MAG: type VI protein secretion system component Hcp [Mariniblastus sp.]|jgi:type VI protein secretion system component Hcp
MITILMTLSTGTGKNSIVVGGSQIKGYEKWILIDSIGFALSGDPESEQDELNAEAMSTTDNNSTKSKKQSSTPQSISIAKTVDCSTVYFMELAAKDRSIAATESRSAKISLFENRSYGSKDSRVETLFPVVQLNLGSVLMKNWSIDASVGDSVARETFSLDFKQFAMVYSGAENGTSFVTHGPRVWDETNQENSFDWPDGKSSWFKS